MLSERLRAAVSDVRGDPYIVHRYSQSAFRSAWRRLQAAMRKAGIEPFRLPRPQGKGGVGPRSELFGHRSPKDAADLCADPSGDSCDAIASGIGYQLIGLTLPEAQPLQCDLSWFLVALSGRQPK